MRAIVLREHGGPEVLRAEVLPDPEPGPGEVRVRVQAVALNYLDVWVRKGLPGLRIRYPFLLGCDVAGRVDGLGAGVTGVILGADVLVSPGVSCGAPSGPGALVPIWTEARGDSPRNTTDWGVCLRRGGCRGRRTGRSSTR